jgi:uncharacterized protein (TIGR03067 family)
MAGDLAALQGSWKIDYLEVAGSQVPSSAFAGAGVTVSGDTFESTGMGAVYRGRLKLVEDGARKLFSLSFEDGPETGNVNHALYKLDGDAWTFCIDTKGGPAPASLLSTAANGYALEKLTRVRS